MATFDFFRAVFSTASVVAAHNPAAMRPAGRGTGLGRHADHRHEVPISTRRRRSSTHATSSGPPWTLLARVVGQTARIERTGHGGCRALPGLAGSHARDAHPGLFYFFITVIFKWPNVRGRHRLATAPPTAPRAWWLPGAPTRKVRSLGRLGTAQVPGRERRFTRNRRRHFSFDWGGRFLPGWGGRFRPTPAVGELRNRSSQPALQFL